MEYKTLGSAKYRFFLNRDCAITFSASSASDIKVLSSGLDAELNGGLFGDTWSITEVLVKSGLDWTGWADYYSSIQTAYRTKLGYKQFYRDSFWTSDKERKAIMWDRHEIACSLYKSRYIPEGVMMPEFIEGPPVKISIFANMANRTGINKKSLFEYFLKSFASQRFSYGPNPNFSISGWSELTQAGLAVCGTHIDAENAAQELSFDEMKCVISSIGDTPKKSKNENIKIIKEYLMSDKDKISGAIFSVRDWTKYCCLMPPSGYDWNEFQSLRQQIKGMATAIVDLYCGEIQKKHPSDYLRLTTTL